MATKGIRREPRAPGVGQAQLEWPDPQRGRQSILARVLDVSESGIRVEVPYPIAPGTYVRVKCKRYEIAGMAGVKHCSRGKTSFEAGLEFSRLESRRAAGTELGSF